MVAGEQKIGRQELCFQKARLKTKLNWVTMAKIVKETLVEKVFINSEIQSNYSNLNHHRIFFSFFSYTLFPYKEHNYLFFSLSLCFSTKLVCYKCIIN